MGHTLLPLPAAVAVSTSRGGGARSTLAISRLLPSRGDVRRHIAVHAQLESGSSSFTLSDKAVEHFSREEVAVLGVDTGVTGQSEGAEEAHEGEGHGIEVDGVTRGRREALMLLSVNPLVLAFLGGKSPRPSNLGVTRLGSLGLCPSQTDCVSTAEKFNDESKFIPSWCAALIADFYSSCLWVLRQLLPTLCFGCIVSSLLALLGVQDIS